METVVGDRGNQFQGAIFFTALMPVSQMYVVQEVDVDKDFGGDSSATVILAMLSILDDVPADAVGRVVAGETFIISGEEVTSGCKSGVAGEGVRTITLFVESEEAGSLESFDSIVGSAIETTLVRSLSTSDDDVDGLAEKR
jgi:hypothetical protein